LTAALGLDALLARKELFFDPKCAMRTDAAPPILIIDDFYDDPDAIRQLALGLDYVSYVPPDPAIIGAELAALNANRTGRWMSSALVAYHGQPAAKPFFGARYNPEPLRLRLEEATGDAISKRSWSSAGDHWNGAFHLVEAGYGVGDGYIHHHYKPGDLEKRGWSGIVYLSPDAPPTAGTSIWQSRRSGRCVAAFGEAYERDADTFELAFLAENRFNRAVLFRESVWHRLEHGFGQGLDARLTQTLFFEVEPSSAN